ncbi:hypothetical protein [Oryza sativa Japonica Group]|uniref:Uncharacterized protein n=1 Tax=Oryza sativa subsp. japonica TaxID=39947 RepID=Q5ZCU5_ORYSJ|nr:hypothetical protein [Oryza sativa Japonica Group]
MAFAIGLRLNGFDVFGLNPCWYYGFGRSGRRASWHASNKVCLADDPRATVHFIYSATKK